MATKSPSASSGVGGAPNAAPTPRQDSAFTTQNVLNFLHIIVLVLSVLLIVTISVDTFRNIRYNSEPEFVKFEFWICIVFLVDFFFEMAVARNKGAFFLRNILFFLVSVPYLPLLKYFDVHIGHTADYVLRFVPFLRGGYALALVVSWFINNRAASLFVTYLTTLFSGVYFSSLIFYVFEHDPNALVTKYTDALWWALMDCTTVGSNIVAVTPVGRVLSVLVAALGMMMFPIFTVYITSVITRYHSSSHDDSADPGANM